MSEGLTTSSCLRLVTWNCCGGLVESRTALLRHLSPDLVFLQECNPQPVQRPDDVYQRTVNSRKGLALVTPSGRYRISPVPDCCEDTVCVAARVDGPLTFHVLVIWAQNVRDYSGNVIRAVNRYRHLFQVGPVVVLGDFNSGVALQPSPRLTRGHTALASHLERDLGLVSAYHHDHRLPHGDERHATHFDQRRQSAAWHIDFGFSLEPGRTISLLRKWAFSRSGRHTATIGDWS